MPTLMLLDVCSTLVLGKASEKAETLTKCVLMSNIACEIHLKDIRTLDTEERHMSIEAVRS